MTSYNGKDRRQALAGISRQTYMDNAAQVFGSESKGFWGMNYDIMAALFGCQKHMANKCDSCFTSKENVDKIMEIADLDSIFIRRFTMGKKVLPISKISFLVIFGCICIGIGAGILEYKGIINLKWLLKF